MWKFITNFRSLCGYCKAWQAKSSNRIVIFLYRPNRQPVSAWISEGGLPYCLPLPSSMLQKSRHSQKQASLGKCLLCSVEVLQWQWSITIISIPWHSEYLIGNIFENSTVLSSARNQENGSIVQISNSLLQYLGWKFVCKSSPTLLQKDCHFNMRTPQYERKQKPGALS